jgi:thiosulfate dehydrogenase [quinone] large subunit
MSEELELRNRDITRAYVLLRVTLGLNICLHGVVRWSKGLHSFAESLVPLFAKTPLPPWSVIDFGYVLPILEALVGAAVLFGLQTRRSLQAGSFLMLLLMFGSSLREDWPTVGIQLTYAVVYCILIAGVSFDTFGIVHRKRSSL